MSHQKCITVKTQRAEEAHKTENAKFMRKGEVGDWKNHVTPELEKKFVEWEKKWLAGSDFQFIYEI